MTSAVVLFLAVFGASSVEAVEAFTLVVAAGATRGWRSAIEGAISALVLLAILVVSIGIPLARDVPIAVLREVVGGLLLILGLGWLRKAILRASGHRALHNEDRIYRDTVAEIAGEPAVVPGGRDAIGFAVAFKGVLLEGVEVVLIVISLGASSHRLALAAGAAATAVLVVAGIGFVVARQLSEIPENAMKLAVGTMLTSFGVFWVGEGSGVRWPGSDLAIIALIGVFAAASFVSIRLLSSIVPSAAVLTRAAEAGGTPR